MLLLEPAQQRDDLRLYRHVEGGGGFVQHHEPRFQHHGPGDGDALALSARELVGIAVARFGFELHFPQGVHDQLFALLRGAAEAVDHQAFLDDLGHGQPRVQRSVGILEDHLHVPPQRPQGPGAQALDVAAIITDRTVAAHQP